eukprot:UN21985
MIVSIFKASYFCARSSARQNLPKLVFSFKKSFFHDFKEHYGIYIFFNFHPIVMI